MHPPTMARAIATRCCSPPLSSCGKAFSLCDKPDGGQHVPRLGDCGGRTRPAHVQRQPHIVHGRQCRKQVVGLKDEANVISSEFGQVTGPCAGRRMATDTAPFPVLASACSQAPTAAWSCRCRTVPSEGPVDRHASDRLTPFKPCNLARAGAEKFDDVDGLDHRFGHCLNTLAGSMRTTCTMAAMADATHITTVSKNRPGSVRGVITIGNADFGGRLDDDQTDARGQREAYDGAEQRLADDDFVNIDTRTIRWRAALRIRSDDPWCWNIAFGRR